ncbi:hypothetical protein FKM82_020276 [Ascaphus truei]
MQYLGRLPILVSLAQTLSRTPDQVNRLSLLASYQLALPQGDSVSYSPLQTPHSFQAPRLSLRTDNIPSAP